MAPSSVSCDSSEDLVFAATLYGEARGECRRGIEAVAHVIKTRARKNRSYWGGSTIKGVCLQREQFECWNWGPIAIKEPDAFEKCREIAEGVKSGKIADPTQGCDHYFNPSIIHPDWADKIPFVIIIGSHQFHKS